MFSQDLGIIRANPPKTMTSVLIAALSGQHACRSLSLVFYIRLWNPADR